MKVKLTIDLRKFPRSFISRFEAGAIYWLNRPSGVSDKSVGSSMQSALVSI
jgi:hypothetical protein